MTNQEFKLKRMGLLVKGMFGLAAVVFAFSALIYTINPAQADAPATTMGGKIMMSESGFVLGGNPMYHVLVWNSETGKSKIYIFDRNSKNMSKAPYQLPASPLY